MQQKADIKNHSKGLLHYQLLLLILFPVLIIYTLYQALKFRNINFALQRLGAIRKPEATTGIWLHAASVGEVNAAIPLLEELQKTYPDKNILVTTTTPTGAQQLEKKNLPKVQHQFLPVDYKFMINRLIRRFQPGCVLIMETELWPNLFRCCYQHNIPVCTVNGRLSSRTTQIRGWIRNLYKTTLQYAAVILTRSDRDSKAYVALGANQDKVRTIGNIKFSAQLNTDTGNHAGLERRYVLAASTRPGEELLIVNQWIQHRLGKKNHLLVIAPRHPKRLDEILDQLQISNQEIAVRSRNDIVTDTTDIYIVDTLGELPGFMADADMVFVGGSLVPLGGHNIMEPASLGKIVLFGPYMDNFLDEAEQLVDFQAAIQLDNAEQLGEKLANILEHPDNYQCYGNNAKRIIMQNQDIASRYVKALSNFIR